MRAAVLRLARRMGRRGAFLTCKGVMAMGYGSGQIVQPTGDQRGLALLLKAAPLDVWGWAWITAGVLAMVCAWLPRGRTGPASSRCG